MARALALCRLLGILIFVWVLVDMSASVQVPEEAMDDQPEFNSGGGGEEVVTPEPMDEEREESSYGDVIAEKRLFREVFGRIDPQVRPATNWSKAVEVEVEFSPVYFKGLNEPLQIFELYTWIALKWHDPQLKWDEEKYGGIQYVTVGASKIWIPDIGIINSAVHLYSRVFEPEKYRAVVGSSGNVRVVFAGTVETICVLDVTYFPYDEQLCHVELDSWSLPVSGLILSDNSFLTMKKLRLNGEWNIEDTWLLFYEEHYRGKYFRTLSFVFRITRKPLFVLCNVIFPCVLLFMMELLVFCIPPEAGEKVSLGITLMLSLTVFQLVIRNSMPETSDFFPLLSVYLSLIMLLSAMTLTFTILVLSVHHRERSRPLPRFLRRILLGRLSTLLRFHWRAEQLFHMKEYTRPPENNSENYENDVSFTSQSTNTRECACVVNDEWILAAKVLDRLFFLIFTIVALVMTFAMFGACIHGQMGRDQPISGFGYDINDQNREYRTWRKDP